jgi:hypothetical protein
MKLKDYIKRIVIGYFIIFAVIVMSISILRQIFAPNLHFELKDINIYMLCSLLSSLTGLILYSPKGLKEKEMRMRIVIHFVVLEAVLLTLANVMGWITGIHNTSLLALQIAVIYVIVRFIIWMDDRRAANQINAKLKVFNDISEASAPDSIDEN